MSWDSNGYHGNGPFPLSSMSQIGNLHQNFVDSNFISLTSGPQQQPYFNAQLGMQSLMTDNDENFPGGDYQSEFGFNNNNAFIQNQMMADPESPGQNTPPSVPTQLISRPALDATAAEIKAKLMTAKERAKSGTPTSSKLAMTAEGTCSLRDSPQTPTGPAGTEPVIDNCNERSAMKLTDEDFAELISGVTTAAGLEIRKENSNGTKDQQRKYLLSTSSGQETPAGPFRRDDTQKGSANADEESTKKISRHLSTSDNISDNGEEQERIAVKATPIGPKAVRPGLQPRNIDEQVLRKRRDEEASGVSQRPESRPRSPRGRSRSPIPRSRETSYRSPDDKYDHAEENLPKKVSDTTKPGYTRSYSESKPKPYQRRDSRDSVENHNQGLIYERVEMIPTKPKPPTLDQLIAIDGDLRDWLLITDYHNVEKRTRTLNRRRALAKLDADRAKLLEEEKAEERGISITAAQTPAAITMPPPLTPVKPSVPTVSAPKKVDDELVRPLTGPLSSTSTAEKGSKRSYSDYKDTRDVRDDIRAEKIGHTDDRGFGTLIKSGRDDGHKQSRIRYSPRLRSVSPPAKSHGWDDRTTESRGRDFDSGRGYDRERDHSPSMQTYESRNPLRSIPSADDYRGRYVERGGYRGKAYDPNHQLKKARSRGYIETEPRPEPRPGQGGYGANVANMNLYRDPIGLDKGGKGDTRYFIVKSFNEENVLHCINDSIWTTQIHNGGMFKKAFQTCKNVILIFSVNQSHAFQGYARMENLPGSERTPSWQNNLHWQSAGAFKIRWLTIAVTRFSRVHHLTNSLNENMAVIVAKDGQEVEERCGVELLKCIDEEFGARGVDKRY